MADMSCRDVFMNGREKKSRAAKIFSRAAKISPFTFFLVYFTVILR